MHSTKTSMSISHACEKNAEPDDRRRGGHRSGTEGHREHHSRILTPYVSVLILDRALGDGSARASI